MISEISGEQSFHSSKAGLCIVCYQVFKTNEISSRKGLSQVLTRLFGLFCSYAKIDQKIVSLFDFQNEPFPFCECCKSTLVHVFLWHDQLVELKKKIDKTISGVTAKLLSSRLNANSNSTNDPDLVVHSKVEKKVDNIRNYVANCYDATVSVSRLEPITSASGIEKIKAEDEADDVASICDDHDDIPEEEYLDLDQQSTEIVGQHTEYVESATSCALKSELTLQTVEQNEENFSTTSLKMVGNQYYCRDKLSFIIKSGRLQCCFCSYSAQINKYRLMMTHLKVRHFDIFNLPTPPKVNRTKKDYNKRNNVKAIHGHPDEFEFGGFTFKVSSSGTLTCSTCNFTTEKRNYLLQHLNKVHIKNFICETCGKGFPLQSRLEVHQMCHTDERPFVCLICSRRFRDTKTLRKHQTMHADPSFECQLCGKQFATWSRLNLHSSSHTNEQRFSCPICFKKFRRPASMYRHKKAVHASEKPYVCPHGCGLRFTQSQSVKRHVRVVHVEKSTKLKENQKDMRNSAEEEDSVSSEDEPLQENV